MIIGTTAIRVVDETVSLAKPQGTVGYYNSGGCCCWTELPCTYLAIKDGHIELNNYL